jgi:peptidoglycan biosynthesis protein MviN/MurJ (putative lipid II flippase)
MMMNVRIVVFGAILFVVCVVVGTLLSSIAPSWNESHSGPEESLPGDVAVALYLAAGFCGYAVLYGLVTRPRASERTEGTALLWMGWRTAALGIGLLPLGGFLLFIAWAVADTEGIDSPVCWLSFLGAVALGILGLWLLVAGLASVDGRGLLPRKSP